ncbi:MAG: BLUF domain-containing protein [Wenzhouxiangellaceae bacterium]
MDSSADLICLTYCSTSTFPAKSGSFGVHPEVTRILVHSRRNNRKREIGGVLHFGDGRFFQYLEGPADDVDRLYATICRDDRHDNVQRLTRRPIRSRRFADWSMKFVAIERLVDQVLRRHGMDEFDPYQFTPAVIDDLVVSCTQAPEEAPDAEAQIETQPNPPRRKGLFARLFG